MTDQSPTNNNNTPTRTYADATANRPAFRVKRKLDAQNDNKRLRQDQYTAGGSTVDAQIDLDKDLPDLESLFERTLYRMIFDSVDPSLAIFSVVLDEMRQYHSQIEKSGIIINKVTYRVFIPFKTMEALTNAAQEYKGRLGTPRDPSTYDPTNIDDTYYRSVLLCSNILAWNSDQEIAQAIAEVTGAQVSNGVINVEENLVSIYTPTKADWIKVETVDTIYPTSPVLARKPGFYVLHKLAATNDPNIYKLFMSGLPANPGEDGVRDTVRAIGASPLIVGLAFNRDTHRAMKYCFVLVEGIVNRDLLLARSGTRTIKRVPIEFALAKPRTNKNANNSFT